MTAFWYNNPSILLDSKHMQKIWPEQEMTYAEKLNAITRLVVILTIIGYIITKSMKLVISGVVTIIGIVVLFLNNPNNTADNHKRHLVDTIQQEGFTGANAMEALKDNFAKPTPENPLQNIGVLGDVTGDDVSGDDGDGEGRGSGDRKPAAPSFNPIVTEQINEAAKQQIQDLNPDIPDMNKKLFRDLGDHENFDNAMRPFYSMPNTRTPNDQKSFSDFCYGDMSSVKEQNEILNEHRFA